MPETNFAQLVVRSPESDEEWQAYYDLRWRLLRAPWQQPHGSERDELDNTAIHRIAIDHNTHIFAIGRLHINDNMTGHIRYMAVEEGSRRHGLGTQILRALETAAQEQACKTIHLHARETAVPFYNYHGYTTVEKSHVLFDEIQHYLMQKYIK